MTKLLLAGSALLLFVLSAAAQVPVKYDSAGQKIAPSLSVGVGPSGTPVPVALETDGRVKISGGAASLPAGAATSAKQDTGNASLASMDAKLATPAARTPSLTVATTTGSVLTGARSVSLAPSADFEGTILGTTITGVTNGAAFDFVAPAGDTIAAIAYTITAGSLTIQQLR